MEGRTYASPTLRKLFPELLGHKNKGTTYNELVNRALLINKIRFMDASIHNQSSKVLSPIMKEVLFKGISFVPAPTKDHALDIKRSLNKLDIRFDWEEEKKKLIEEGMKLKPKHPFYKYDRKESDKDKEYRRIYSTIYIPEFELNDNLKAQERKELSEWMTDKSVTIKRADKGGGIVILDTDKYISQVNEEHLVNPITYQEIDHCPTLAITRDTNSLIDYLLTRYRIDEQTAKFLRPPVKLRTPVLYGLPKLHKPDIPLRPVVSAIENPTDYLSHFITHFLQPLAQTVPAYLSDSKDFKQHLSQIPALPLNSILVTADVVSLYTNIPQSEGIDTTCEFIQRNRDLLPEYAPSTQVFRLILHHILLHSHFTFNTRHFIQTFGTAIGCRMAAPFANI